MDLDRNSLALGTKPALIVVDMIQGFTDPECPLGGDYTNVVAANVQLLDLFRDLALPVFFTTVIYHAPDQAKIFRKRLPALNLLTPDSDCVKIDPALARRDNETLIEKQWASAFHQTDLADHLTACGADSLIITGLTTSGCVRATVVDGLQYDYPVIVPREAVGDRNAAAHDANLFDIHAKYGDVLPLNEVIGTLS